MPMKYSGDNLTFPDNSIQSTAATGFGFKNRIINGAMMIDQRNAGASVTTSGNAYSLDRWAYYVTQASKMTVQQNAGSVTPPAGFKNYLGVTSSSAYSVISSDFFEIYQQIEGFNIADLAWGTASASPVTLSFWVRSSLTGAFGGFLSNSGSTRVYPFTYTINSANTWEQKTITIAGDTTGTWLTNNAQGIQLAFALGAGSNFNGAAGAWNAGSGFVPSGSVSLVGTSGATFYITGVQLEKGSTATSFDYRPYGTELALCQRYYQTIEGVGSTVGGTNNATFTFVVEMRATPTIGTVTQNTGSGITFTNCATSPTQGRRAIAQIGNSTANAYMSVPLSAEL